MKLNIKKTNEIDIQKRGPSTRRRPLGDITNTEVVQLPITQTRSSSDSQPQGQVQIQQSQSQATLNTITSTSDILINETPRDEDIEVIELDRPYMNREVDDIDARDSENALLCSRYVSKMYDFFWEVENQFLVNCEYMTRQPFINDKMRCILVDWLVEVHLKFKMVPETLYLTVNVIDRYLEKQEVRRSKLQLVGVAALLLAAKYEEIYPPELHDLVFITDRAYNAKEIVEMEATIMKALDFNLTIPTIHTFLCRYLKAAHADRTMVQMSCYLAERSLQEYCTLKYPPSLIAAKAIHAARMSLRRHPWSPTLVHYTRYDEPDFTECGNEMRDYLAANSQQTAVYRKYSGVKFGSVARMPITV